MGQIYQKPYLLGGRCPSEVETLFQNLQDMDVIEKYLSYIQSTMVRTVGDKDK